MQGFFKTIKVVLIIIAVFFMALILLSYVFEDKIKSLTIQALNKNLKTEIKVGAISFSVIRNFPYASVQFNDMICKGSNRSYFVSGNLVEAKSVKLLLNLSSLFGSNYKIKRIIVTDATINLLTDKDGITNYDIFKPDSSSGNVSFKIEKAIGSNIHIYQKVQNKNFEQEIHVNDLQAEGDFSQDVFTANLSTNAFVHFINSGTISYITEKEVALKGAIAVDQKANKFSFENAEAKVARLVLKGKGEMQTKDSVTEMNLIFSSKDAHAGELLSVLPKGILPAQFNDYTFKGIVDVELAVNGKNDHKESPVISVKFGTNGTDIIPDNELYALRKAAMQGFFTTKKSAKNPVTYLQVKNFNALLEGKPVKASVEIENFESPYYNIAAEGEISAASLLKYIAIDTLKEANGLLKLKGNFKGQAGKPGSYISSGFLEVINLSFRLKQKPLDFKNFNGSFAFNGNDVTLNIVNGMAGKSDLKISGMIKNMYAWIVQKNTKLYIDASVYSNYLDLNEFVQTENVADTTTKIDFSDNLELDLVIRSQKTTFKKFTAEQVAGNITLTNKILSTNALKFNAVDGSVYLQGSINANQPDSLFISYDANVSNLNIQKLFYQMGNFGQEVLTEKNLKGSVTSTIQLASVWSKTLNVNTNKIFATADVTINNGELLNFEPMLKLSRFVKGTDLRNIKFSTLKNSISIANRKINIPVMEINSTAMNITASGTHTFDNLVDYKIKMRMSELLGKKVRNLNTEFGVIEDDGKGQWNLFLSMKGPLDNPKFSYDKKSVEENITKSVKEGKDNFLKIIKEEFKITKPEKKTEPSKKQDELQLETEEDS